MQIIKRFFLFLSVCIIGNLYSQTGNDPSRMLPKSIDGWEMTADRLFNNETLFDYIDGGAELFLSFGFSKVFNRNYSNGKNDEIVVDIFYMNTSYDAYGAFLFTIGKMDNKFGQQSQSSPGAVIFWKNNFYVSITSTRVTEDGNKVILKLAEILDKSITEPGSRPEIINYLPAKGMDEESIRYFRHYIWLNSHFFISNDNILNINQKTEAATAKYGAMILVIIKYLNDEDAVMGTNKFISSFNTKLDKNPVIKTGENWTGIERNGKFFIGVFNGPDENSVKGLISAVNGNIKQLQEQ